MTCDDGMAEIAEVDNNNGADLSSQAATGVNKMLHGVNVVKARTRPL